MLELEQVLREHLARYPKSEPQDAVKLCYQMELGGGHLITDPEVSLRRLSTESAVAHRPGVRFEGIGNGLMRLHLGGFGDESPSIGSINRAFIASSETVRGSISGLERRLRALTRLCAEGRAPFSPGQLEAYLAGYRAKGYPMVSHSEAYREAYLPTYRVMLQAFEALWPLMARIDRTLRQTGRALVAIDGNSGSGKSTHAALLRQVYSANLLHMDDYFLPPARKTSERLSEPGGNVDYERFSDMLWPLARGEQTSYQRYDCQRGQLLPPATIEPKPVTIVEGVYSLHPALREAYDIRAFCSVVPEEQSRRILARSGEALHKRFLEEWIPLENAYFEGAQVRSQCDLIIET